MTSEDGRSISSKRRPNKFLERSSIWGFFNQSFVVTNKLSETEAALFFLKVTLLFSSYICWADKIYQFLPINIASQSITDVSKLPPQPPIMIGWYTKESF